MSDPTQPTAPASDPSTQPASTPPTPTTPAVTIVDTTVVHDAFLELLASKKLMLALLSMISWLLARIGLHVDPATALAFISPLLAAIVAQGVADHGKGAEQVRTRRIALMTGQPTLVKETRMRAAVGTMFVVLVAAMAVGVYAGCGASAAIAQGANTFGSCSEVKIETLVDGKDPVVATVAIDLVSADYADAITALIAKIGEDAVACAVLAIDQVFSIGQPSTMIATTTTTTTPTLPLIQARAREMISKHGWDKKYGIGQTTGATGKVSP